MRLASSAEGIAGKRKTTKINLVDSKSAILHKVREEVPLIGLEVYAVSVMPVFAYPFLHIRTRIGPIAFG